MARERGTKTSVRGIEKLTGRRYQVRGKRKLPSGEVVSVRKVVEANSVKDAAALREQLLDEASRTGPQPQRLRSFADVVDAWIEDAREKRLPSDPRQKNWLPRTARANLSRSKILKKYFGHVAVSRLTPGDVENYKIVRSEEGKSPTTINSDLRLFKQIMKWAGYPIEFPNMPTKGTTKISRTDPNKLNPIELSRFLETAKKVAPRQYPLIFFLAVYGTRISEALVMRWEDFDLDRGEVLIRRRLSYNEVHPGTKTDRWDERVHALYPPLWAVLQKHKSEMTPEQIKSGWVFANRFGQQPSQSYLNRAWRRIIDELNLGRRFTIHGLRRTAETRIRDVAGGEIAKALAGHDTDAMLEHYAAITTETKLATMRLAFDAVLDLAEK